MSVRTAIIGVGGMGRKYAEMITAGQVKDMTLTAVVARRPEVRDWAENLVNGDKSRPNVYASSEELFNNPEMYDAVLIVTPHKTHPEFAKRAFELGKHVLCDKPAGVTINIGQRRSWKTFKNYACQFKILQNGGLSQVGKLAQQLERRRRRRAD